MSEMCPDCGRPFAAGLRSYRWGGACGLQLSRTEHNDTNELELNCATVTIALLRQKLAASEREVARLKPATPGGQAELREEILAYDFEDKAGG